MFCPKCGKDNPKENRFCAACGTMLSQQAQQNFGSFSQNNPMKEVPNYLIPAILVTLFCCIPAGIPAIIFAIQVNERLARNDYEGAVKSSYTAKLFCWIGFGLGFIIFLTYVFYFIFVISERKEIIEFLKEFFQFLEKTTNI